MTVTERIRVVFVGVSVAFFLFGFYTFSGDPGLKMMLLAILIASIAGVLGKNGS